MSHLLKRTKKSCLKLLRKISTSKQLFVQRLEEEEISSNCNIETITDNISFEHQLESGKIDRQYEMENERENERKSQETQNVSTDDIDSTTINPKGQQVDDFEQLIHGLTTKFCLGLNGYEFSRLQQLPSDATSEQLECEKSPLERLSMESDVYFERVPYKENVRYLRHTPSNSSLDLQQQQLQQQQQVSQANSPLSVHTNTEIEQWQLPISHPCSISLGSKINGNYHNVVITESHRDEFPIVKWDINGNSIDDEESETSLPPHWEEFDNRWRQLMERQKSSHQSSSCTLETWLDDTEQPHNDSITVEHPLPHHLNGSNNINNMNNNNSNKNLNLCLTSV